jgi:hypothetical protein
LDDHGRALERLKALGAESECSHPGAAASLREGIDETLMLTRLGVTGSLKGTLASTNPCESMIECVRDLAKLCVSIERDISGRTITASNAAASALALP